MPLSWRSWSRASCTSEVLMPRAPTWSVIWSLSARGATARAGPAPAKRAAARTPRTIVSRRTVRTTSSGEGGPLGTSRTLRTRERRARFPPWVGGSPTSPSSGGTMSEPDRIPAADLPPSAVRRVGGWAVGNTGGEYFAVSRPCRHQLADLAEGSIDADGCLVCPWHQSRYDARPGEMVEGPRGFLGYHGPTPVYTQLVRAYGKWLRLRVRKAIRRGDQVEGS